ncbi:enoyl-CoA hydratase [Tardibacter chloracetimidivorans]|uniref:Enoyl-CoA hydratase n=1 Tax=Tardibacter chloracetimidivorans TaxID=1921510 RepID=A0A1L3ZXH6_9SPHN|nr:enoyl-CoA hydratase-related protein [Tardibacter chloracetimidivorans]API60310.1 enoyl-CoA hydratase [Tardibacter chloracetimidivorans]
MTGGAHYESSDGIATITMDRPEVRNALDAATSRLIDEMLSRAEADADVGVIIVTGAGDKAFCSGMDLKEAARTGPGHGLLPGRGFAGLTEGSRSKPVIAAVNGAAVAGGFEIALACDIIVAADHAVFGLPEVKRGMFAFAGGVQRLAHLVPRSTAMTVILTGDPLPAARLHELGVISALVGLDQLMPTARKIAQTINANSRPAISGARRLFQLSADLPLDEALRVGREIDFASFSDPDTAEGIAAYAEGRAAAFRKPI